MPFFTDKSFKSGHFKIVLSSQTEVHWQKRNFKLLLPHFAKNKITYNLNKSTALETDIFRNICALFWVSIVLRLRLVRHWSEYFEACIITAVKYGTIIIIQRILLRGHWSECVLVWKVNRFLCLPLCFYLWMKVQASYGL